MRHRVQAWSPTNISEYTYGLCITIEVVQQLGGVHRLLAAPLMPSLQQEADLGFDLALEAEWALLCLQFKISTKLERRNAGQAATFGVPYFRFDVKTNSTGNGRCQHNTLCLLQQTLGRNAGVYYAAPLFDSPDELTTHAQNAALTDNSVFVPPLQLGVVPAGEHHFFAYSTHNNIRHYSEPGSPFDGSFDATVDRIYSTFEGPQTLEEFLRSCDSKFVYAIEGDRSQHYPPEAMPGRVAAFVAAEMDLQPIVVGRLSRA